MPRRLARKLQHTRDEALADTLTLEQRIARLEGGELHRDTGTGMHRPRGCLLRA